MAKIKKKNNLKLSLTHNQKCKNCKFWEKVEHFPFGSCSKLWIIMSGIVVDPNPDVRVHGKQAYTHKSFRCGEYLRRREQKSSD